MQLSQTNAYAITAMIQLGSLAPGRLLSCKAICRGLNMPDRYVQQLLRQIVAAGLAISIRGRDGGYRLAKLADRISLLEIIEAVDGKLGRNSHVEIAGMTRVGAAVVSEALARIAADTRKRLAAITLADLRHKKAA